MTYDTRLVVIALFDRKTSRVKIGHAGFDDKDWLDARSLPEGRNTLSRTCGYPINVRIAQDGGTRLITITGADGVPIYASNPGQHPDSFEAGKRAFRLIGGVQFLAYEDGVLGGRDELVSYETYGQMEELGAPLIAVPYVTASDGALSFDVLSVHGKPLRTVGITAAACKPFHQFDLSLGEGRLVRISSELTREPEQDNVVTFTPMPGVVFLETMPSGDQWFHAKRLSSLVWTLPSSHGSLFLDRRHTKLVKNTMESFADERERAKTATPAV